MTDKIYYYFEYDRPPSAKTGRPRKPARTSYRMTLEDAKERHGDKYRPLMDTGETYQDVKWESFVPYAPGTGPIHLKPPTKKPERQ